MPASGPGLLMTVFAFAVTIGVLVFVHEMGHYLVGRWFGVKADRFSIGFGREVAGWTDRRGTRWTVGMLPLGGFVQFAGDADAASRPAAPSQADAGERRHWFSTRPVGQRALIVLAGPAINFLLAILILSGFALAYGEPVTPPRIAKVLPDSAAVQIGLQPADTVLTLNGRQIESYEQIQQYVILRPGEPVRLTVERDGRAVPLAGRIGQRIERDRFGNDHRFGQLGIQGGGRVFRPVPAIEAPLVGARQTWAITLSIVDTVTQIVRGSISSKELGGPLKIAQVSGEFMDAGIVAFVGFVAMISINLGFINLLPIPMLDGGHLLLYAIEAVRGRPPSIKSQEWAFRGGFALVVAFMMFVTFNDLSSFGLFRT